MVSIFEPSGLSLPICTLKYFKADIYNNKDICLCTSKSQSELLTKLSSTMQSEWRTVADPLVQYRIADEKLDEASDILFVLLQGHVGDDVQLLARPTASLLRCKIGFFVLFVLASVVF